MKTRHDDSESIEAEHRLYEAIVSLKSVEEAKQFFEDLCTPTERQAMSDRWRVVEPVKQEIPYRTIYEQTGVSVTTIGRVARCLSLGTGGYNLVYERLKRKTHADKRKTYDSNSEKGPPER